MGLLINGEENKIEKAISTKENPITRPITFKIKDNVAYIDGPLVVGDKIKLTLHYKEYTIGGEDYSEEKVFEVSNGETTITFNANSNYKWYNKTATFDYSNKTITYNSIDAGYIKTPKIDSFANEGISLIKDACIKLDGYIKLDGTVIITGPIQIEEL